MGMTNEQLLQSITTVIVDRFDMLDGRIERLEQRGVMFIAHHFFGDHLRLMFWQHSGLHK